MNMMSGQIVNTLLGTIAPDLKKVKAENNVSVFVETNATNLFVIEGEGKEIGELLCKVMISYCNHNPKEAVGKMKKFSDNFVKFYGENTCRQK